MTNNNSTYKRLGDYIREINVRNKDLSVTKLMGINIEKYFMPSVANVIGTDMTNYKVVANGQFACNLMHVGRDEKIPVALNTEDSIIVSPAYFVFEVCNEALLPEYLELSFRNPEFDRNAWFHTDADVRGGMDKDGMKDLLIPVPPIEEQRSIVNRYKAIENRIANNKQTIAKLEEAAQALYRKMFVDGIDVENLPEGWRMGCLGEVCSISAGGDKPECFSENRNKIHSIPIFANGIENDGLYGYTDRAKITLPSVTISARGTIGFVCLRTEPYVPIVRLLVCIPNKIISNSFLYLFYLLKNTKLEGDGAVQLQLTAPKFKDVQIVIPIKNMVEEFDKNVSSIVRFTKQIKKENEKLMEMLSVVMA